MSSYTIEQLSAEQARAALPELIELLRDSVEGGASVGFLPPLQPADAQEYWQGVIAGLASESRMLLVAQQGGRLVGTVQLEPAAKLNASHRAEVQKLLVHRAARRQGIGRALMREAEAAALGLGRTLLVLDTRAGDLAEQLYRSLGYVCAGEIPRYARSADGRLTGTLFFYRFLDT